MILIKVYIAAYHSKANFAKKMKILVRKLTIDPQSIQIIFSCFEGQCVHSRCTSIQAPFVIDV